MSDAVLYFSYTYDDTITTTSGYGIYKLLSFYFDDGKGNANSVVQMPSNTTWYIKGWNDPKDIFNTEGNMAVGGYATLEPVDSTSATSSNGRYTHKPYTSYDKNDNVVRGGTGLMYVTDTIFSTNATQHILDIEFRELGSYAVAVYESGTFAIDQDNVANARAVFDSGSSDNVDYYLIASEIEPTQEHYNNKHTRGWFGSNEQTMITQYGSENGYMGSNSEATQSGDYVLKVINADTSTVIETEYPIEYDGNTYIIRIEDLNGNPIYGGITWNVDGTEIVADSLSRKNVCLHRSIEALVTKNSERTHLGPVSFSIVKRPITQRFDDGYACVKYYDGTVVGVLSPYKYTYEGIVNYGVVSDEVIVGYLATFPSPEPNIYNNSTTGYVHLTYTLEGKDAENYRMDDAYIDGQIYSYGANGTPAAKQYSIKIDGGAVTIDNENNATINYDGNPHTIQVYKGTSPVTLSSETDEVSWIYNAKTLNYTATRMAMVPSLSYTNAGTYSARVYVTNSDFPSGYAYIGEVVLTINPIINVHWYYAAY